MTHGNRKPLADIIAAFPGTMTSERCNALVSKGVALTRERMEYYVTNKHMLHVDVHEDNVLFTFHPETFDLTSAELIDWSRWISQTVRILFLLSDESIYNYLPDLEPGN